MSLLPFLARRSVPSRAQGAGRGFTSPRRRSGAGFTLIELLVVLVIIGVLGALIVPNLFSSLDDARATAARTDIKTLVESLKRYKIDNQRYPTAEQGLDSLVRKPAAGPTPPNWKPYLDKLPADPWGRQYQFLNPGVNGEIDVFSFGADGQPGGEGINADLGSWQ
ncbi:MAG: type II secretion system major pseudopilin GspG [Betaproteobacteria bacterium]|nr:type II secretion system major pseudopilin GspG [Betaproteobacteria bacterium]